MSNTTPEFRSDVRFHETVSIPGRISKETADSIVLYCKDLAAYLRKRQNKPELKATLTIDGVCTNLSNKKNFFDFLENVYTSEALELDVFFDGCFVHPYGSEIGFRSKVQWEKPDVNFNYKSLTYYYEYSSVGFDKIENGTYVNLGNLMNTEYPLSVKDTSSWESVQLYMGYYRDDITDEQAEKIQNIVGKYISEEALESTKSDWAECNDVVLTNVEWVPESFKVVSDFLDELNGVVVLPEEDSNQHKPESDELNTWFDMKNYAVAFFAEVDGKFVLLGTDF